MAAYWKIGCFNRPWSRWTYDEALDGIRSAGYRLTGLLGGHKDEPFTSPEATPEYLDRLNERIKSRGLTVNMSWLRTSHNVPLSDSVRQSRKQIDNATRLGLKYLLSGGVSSGEQYDHYYQVMSDASAYAEQQGIQIVIKPHGGCCASADEILSCIEKVNHPNFRLWYDAGNIIHYTGKDPNEDVARIAHLVTGFCAKDCGEMKGAVMIQFGEGKVDFTTVFSELKVAGFDGPVMVECCGGQTLEEVTPCARANREFLQGVLSSI